MCPGVKMACILMLPAVAALAACSFSPDTYGSAIDCASGKPCPDGWYCPSTGTKVCIKGTGPGNTCNPGAADCDGGVAGGKDAGQPAGDGGPGADGGGSGTDGGGETDGGGGTGGDAGDDAGPVDAGGGADAGCNGCMEPPASTCVDAHTLKTYDVPGACAADVCSYTQSSKDCYYGCANGTCVECTPDCTNKECGDDGCGEPCGMCDKPPADACLDASTVRDYELAGTCPSSTCEYKYADRFCQYGCAGGACKGCQPSCGGKECGDDGCGGSCGGCTKPPPDSCASGSMLRKYNAAGSCPGTTCSYTYKDQACTYGCASSKCNPCPPDCGGKQCGDDGCGGPCGGCGGGYHCVITTCAWDGATYEAESGSMGHTIGRRDAEGWSADTNADAKGVMLYGPYTTDVPAGARTASYRMLVDNHTADNGVVVRIEVNDHSLGEHVIASRDVRRQEFTGAFVYQDFDLAFTNATAGHELEFRVYWWDISYVRIDKVIVR